MAKGAYTYEPGRLKEPGMDRMRFELGDVMVEGGSETTALTDEEIQAALENSCCWRVCAADFPMRSTQRPDRYS